MVGRCMKRTCSCVIAGLDELIAHASCAKTGAAAASLRKRGRKEKRQMRLTENTSHQIVLPRSAPQHVPMLGR